MQYHALNEVLRYGRRIAWVLADGFCGGGLLSHHFHCTLWSFSTLPRTNGVHSHWWCLLPSWEYGPAGHHQLSEDGRWHSAVWWPRNLTVMRSFMGLVNQLTKFWRDIPALAQLLCPLMNPKYSFIWNPDHDQVFENIKKALLSPPVLVPFDLTLPVILQTDASHLYSIGYALFQDLSQGWVHLVQCVTRFLTVAKTNYIMTELELLAVTWAICKCWLYIFGLQHFTLMTKHHPLIPILNHYTLDVIESPRLQRLKEVAPYIFTAVWHARKQLCIPNALSRGCLEWSATPHWMIMNAL